MGTRVFCILSAQRACNIIQNYFSGLSYIQYNVLYDIVVYKRTIALSKRGVSYVQYNIIYDIVVRKYTIALSKRGLSYISSNIFYYIVVFRRTIALLKSIGERDLIHDDMMISLQYHEIFPFNLAKLNYDLPTYIIKVLNEILKKD